MTFDPLVPHRPNPPEWSCRSCGAQWPCEPARAEMLAEYGTRHTLALTTYMTAFAYQAGMELGDAITPAELWQRFLGWIRPPSIP